MLIPYHIVKTFCHHKNGYIRRRNECLYGLVFPTYIYVETFENIPFINLYDFFILGIGNELPEADALKVVPANRRVVEQDGAYAPCYSIGFPFTLCSTQRNFDC